MSGVRTWWVTLQCGHNGVAARSHQQLKCTACDAYSPIVSWDREKS